MSHITSLLRPLYTRPVMLLYPLAIILFTAAFIGFHAMANQVPQSFLAQKLSGDFKNYNLSKHNYPFSAYGSLSILSNTGQNQFTECAVLLSALSTQAKGLKAAVLPLTAVRSTSQACVRLQEVVASVQSGEGFQTKPIRSQYWWGARPVYSFMLRYFSVYQTRELIRNATALAYTALAIALLYISSSMLLLSAPLLIFGVMFSGASYYSEVILGVPYLWALIGATMVASLHAAKVRASFIHLSVFCIGMVSSYLWLLDGHLILLIAWLMMISFFASIRTQDPVEAILSTVKHGVAFSGGFASAYMSGQLVKAVYLGFGSVWHTLTGAVATRISDVVPGNADLNLSVVFDKVWGIGYWWTGLLRNELLWTVVLWSSMLAALLGISISLIRGVRGDHRVLYAILLCLLIVLSVLARLFFLQNHSVIHAFFIGRYMFIPLAMAWVVLLIGLFGVGKPIIKPDQRELRD